MKLSRISNFLKHKTGSHNTNRKISIKLLFFTQKNKIIFKYCKK